MLLRSGRDLSDDPDKRLGFKACCIQQGHFIRSGGLRHPSRFQQVCKQSYENLARINECGFITVDSVDAHNSRPDDQQLQHTVHSTITGFMLPETLAQFKKVYLMYMPSVCLIHHVVVDEVIQTIQTRIPVNYYYYGDRVGVQASVYMYFSQSSVASFKKQVHLKADESVEFITLVDMRGKYKANEERGLFTQLNVCLSAMIRGEAEPNTASLFESTLINSSVEIK